MYKSYQQGFSLIEILISTVLALILLAGLLQIYLSVKSTYQLQHSLNTIQENARFAVNYLNQNIRLTGYSDCTGAATSVTQENAANGYSSNNLPYYLHTNRVVQGSDVVVIKRCEKFGKDPKPQFIKMAFFIADTLQKTPQGSPIYGLYQKRIDDKGNTDAVEIASGVTNMQIKYGIAAGKDIGQYLTANQLTDWNKVKSLQINLDLTATQIPQKQWHTYITLRERN